MTSFTSISDRRLNLGLASKAIEYTAGYVIEKGSVQYILPDNEHFKISKKGADIKEKVNLMIDSTNSKSDLLYEQLAKLKSQIGEEPTIDHWKVEDFASRNISTPKAYEYMGYSTEQFVQENPKQKYKEEYNRHLGNYIELLCDKSILKTFSDNIQPNQSYSLTLRQANALGF